VSGHDFSRAVKRQKDRRPQSPSQPHPSVLKDANAIQLSVMQIMQLLLSGQIEQKTAGRLASSNLKHINFEPETKNEIVIDPRKTAETRLGQPLWKNSDFEETGDGKINLDDYDLPDLTIRVIDQMKKQSGMEPTPRDVRERYAPLDSDR
jgi:hypothetical protein